MFRFCPFLAGLLILSVGLAPAWAQRRSPQVELQTVIAPVSRAQLDLHTSALFPFGGPFGGFYDTGIGTGVDLALPVGPRDEPNIWAMPQFFLLGGFYHAILFPNDNNQILTEPSLQALKLNTLNLWLANIGLAYQIGRLRGIPEERLGEMWFVPRFGGSVSLKVGGASMSTSPVLPAHQGALIPVTFAPHESGVAVGLHSGLFAGLTLPNGWDVCVTGGYGLTGTNVLTGTMRGLNTAEVGLQVKIPIVGSLFRNRTRRENRELLIMTTPRIVYPGE